MYNRIKYKWVNNLCITAIKLLKLNLKKDINVKKKKMSDAHEKITKT